MRVLLLLRGSAGCGKSTYIKEHGLKPYTLCADDIRLLCQSPVLQIDGERTISQNNESVVWKTLFRLLETRMEKGEFTVIDATNSKTTEMNRYKELAKLYRYRIYCIDMTDIPIEETKRRNRLRDKIKQVPDEVIDKFYLRFETQQIPSGIKVLKPDELDTIWYKPMDLSEYKKIHVIGDIHGCATALKEYFETYTYSPDEYYIFCGDYIDRGVENAETLTYLMDLSKCSNVGFIEGNHERWLWLWANNLNSKSKDFALYTKPQLERAGIEKKRVREFYRKLAQCYYFTYKGKEFIVTHGGISNIPENLTKIATVQMIKGVGNYQDADDVDITFTKVTPSNTYQIHGHRNITKTPIKVTDRTFNLEGEVEFGGYLRAIQISDVIDTIEIKNDIYQNPKEREDRELEMNEVDMSVLNLVEKMRMNCNVYERNFGRISSFNFTRQAFEKGAWDTIVNKARGLYIDVVDYKIVARAYDKFFNINERLETRLGNLKYNLQFPVTAYVKENGFLGIVGWNTETDDLLITTKSNPTGDYATHLENALYSIYGEETVQKIRDYIKENNVSFIFECCDMVNDPHIIKYSENKLILLDIVKNQLNFEKLSYEELKNVANDMGIKVKIKACVLNDWNEFYDWYNEVNDENYKYEGEYIEGFVIEDTSGYMTKLKLYYYKFWKHLRSVAHSVFKYGNYKRTGSLTTTLENQFYNWCRELYNSSNAEVRSNIRDKVYMNICFLRDEFLKWKTEQSSDKEMN